MKLNLCFGNSPLDDNDDSSKLVLASGAIEDSYLICLNRAASERASDSPPIAHPSRQGRDRSQTHLAILFGGWSEAHYWRFRVLVVNVSHRPLQTLALSKRNELGLCKMGYESPACQAG